MTKVSQRRLKKKIRKSPGRKSKISYKRKKRSFAKCALCKERLKGVPPESRKKKLSKTKRRPSVMFGGILCSKCREKIIKKAALRKYKLTRDEEIDLREEKFIKQAEKAIE